MNDDVTQLVDASHL